MKFIKNETFKKIIYFSDFGFYDVQLIFENASRYSQKILLQQYKYFQMVEDKKMTEVFPGAKKIAEKVGCCEKTVHRFNANFGAYIQKKRRFSKGKQTSNSYKMHKQVFQFLKALDKLGAFKEGIDLKEYLKWVEKLWIKAGCDWVTFMNNIYNYKSPKSNGFNTSYKKSLSKMSHGENPKCPTISYSLSFISKYSTQKVPFSQKMQCEREIERICRKSWEDYEFYVSKGNFIRNPEAFFRNRIHNHSRCLIS